MHAKINLLFAIGAISCQHSAAKKIEETLLTGEGYWVQESIKPTAGWHLQFAPNGKLTYYVSGEGGLEVAGKFKVEGSKVIIEVTEESRRQLSYDRKNFCMLADEINSLRYTKVLDCGARKFYGFSFRSVNRRQKFGEAQIVTLGGQQAHILESTMFRTSPSLMGKKIYCMLKRDGVREKIQKSSSLPARQKINVLARTLEKQKVNAWANYWYLVEPQYDAHDGEKCQENVGWLYGEFVEFENNR